MRIITNNPRKIKGLEGYGLEIVGRVPIQSTPHSRNVEYLRVKKEKMGHLITNLDDFKEPGAGQEPAKK